MNSELAFDNLIYNVYEIINNKNNRRNRSGQNNDQ